MDLDVSKAIHKGVSVVQPCRWCRSKNVQQMGVVVYICDFRFGVNCGKYIDYLLQYKHVRSLTFGVLDTDYLGEPIQVG